MKASLFVDQFMPSEYSPYWDISHLYTTNCCDDIAELEADIISNGILDPVLVDNADYVVNGHHRVMIALKHDLDIPFETQASLWEGEYES